jgi:sugar-specific transcriptional regulator TrmB
MNNELIGEKERAVFEALVSFGPSAVSQIAKDTSLNRTALYHTLNLLEEKGLVFEIKKNDTTLFQSISEDEFVLWTKSKIKSLEEGANKLTQSFKKKKHPVLHSGIRYFEGKEAVKKLYGETWRENNEKQILAITDYQKAYETLDGFFDEEYFPARVKAGVRVKSLLSLDAYGKRDKNRAEALLREMRVSPVFKDLGIEINIFDDKLAIVAFDNKEPMGMILKNKIISDAFRKIFTHLWQNSKK